MESRAPQTDEKTEMWHRPGQRQEAQPYTTNMLDMRYAGTQGYQHVVASQDMRPHK